MRLRSGILPLHTSSRRSHGPLPTFPVHEVAAADQLRGSFLLPRASATEQGKEAVVAVLGPDEFCGEGCLTGQPRRIATAVAMTECEIMRLEKAAMIRVLHKEPAFSEMFIAHLLARTIRVEADLVDQLFNSSEKRLARALLLLANFGKDGRPERIIAKVSQETLAEMIGTTRSRVSYFMNKFRKLGFIAYNGHLEVHSSLLNVVLHDQPEISDAQAAAESSDAKVG
jgi:CRP/FNR family transcriptional regulator, cyclic AMP receptor protein